MPAALPVVVQVVATPAPSEDQLHALLESCSGAVGAGRCAPPEADTGEVRARIVVRFAEDLARVHVEIAPASRDAGAGARDADFRASDPALDRYRTAGLLAADLVLDREREPRQEPGPSPSPSLSLNPLPPADSPPADAEAAAPALPSVEAPRSPPLLAAHVAGTAVVAATREQSWWTAVLSADLGPWRSPFFATTSVLYGETWTPNAAGISAQRFAAAAGAGARVPISGPVSLRASAEVQLNDLRASVVQPGTGRTDTRGRWLAGAGADVAFVIRVGGPVDIEAGARAAWLGDSTLIRVQGQPAATISSWTAGISMGVGVRFP
jgi:hypothetical protein